MRLIFIISLISVLFPSPVQAGGDDCKAGDERCEWYRKPPGMLPAIPDMVCIYYIQPNPDKVILTIYAKDGRVIHLAPKFSQSKDYQCIGRHWIAKSTRINLCNGVGDADYIGEDLAFLATKPRNSAEQTACLFGSVECERRGFRVRAQD